MKNKKPDLYLHIGLEKTGTTSIQYGLANSRSTLKKEGVLYPKTPGETNHLKLCVYALNEKQLHNLHTLYINQLSELSMFRENFKSELEREIALSKCNRVIMSSEHLSSNLGTVNQIQTLANLLKPMFENIYIIVYLRRQDTLHASRYSTQLKAGKSIEFSTETDNYLDMDFAKLLTRWETIFGKSKMIVRWFDRQCFIENNLLKDFQNCLGLNSGIPNSKKNESLDVVRLSFLKEFNNQFKDLKGKPLREYRNNIVTALENMDSMGEKLSLSLDQSKVILECYEGSNAEILCRYPCPEVAPDLSPSGNEIGIGLKPLSATDAVVIAQKLWLFKSQAVTNLLKELAIKKDLLSKKTARVSFYKGEALQYQGLFDDAEKAFKYAVKNDEANPVFQNRLKMLAKKKNKHNILERRLKKVSKERDEARKSLKALTNTSQASMNEALGTFNEKRAALISERDALSVKLKKVGEKHTADIQTLKAQSEALIKERDKINVRFNKKSTQIQKQAGQVYYSRAELLKVKDEINEAKKMYLKALECDPNNSDYLKKLDLLT